MFKTHLILFSLIFLTLPKVFGQDLTIVGDNGFAPFSFVEEGTLKGIDYDLVVEAAKRAGVKVSITFRPFKRVVRMVEKGIADAGFALFKTKEREEFAFYSDTPLHNSDYAIFTLKGKEFGFSDLKDLNGRTLSKNLGFSISHDFDRALEEKMFSIIQKEGDLACLKLLESGAVTGHIGNTMVVQYLIRKVGKKDFYTRLPKKLTRGRPAYFVLSKRKAQADPKKYEHFKKINKEIAKMEAEGVYTKIHKKYL